MNLGRDTIEPLISSCSRNLHLHLFTDSSNKHLLNLCRDGTYSLPEYREWYERARDWDWGSQHLKRRGRRPREWDRRSKGLPFLACGSSLVPLSHFSGSASLLCKPFLTLSPLCPLRLPIPPGRGAVPHHLLSGAFPLDVSGAFLCLGIYCFPRWLGARWSTRLLQGGKC